MLVMRLTAIAVVIANPAAANGLSSSEGRVGVAGCPLAGTDE